MKRCRQSFVAANGERFDAGPDAVTRVADDHEILVAYGDHFEDDPTQLGTTRWRDTQARVERPRARQPQPPKR